LGLAEKADQSPPEALLQQVWLHQRLVSDRLQTTDGQPIKILHPGFWNREAGPDFKKAVVQIGANTPVIGDVEIDLVSAGWERHSHAGNPAYRNVVLHVTWEPESRTGNLASLCLKHALDSTVPELTFWLGVEPKPMPAGLVGRCSGPLAALEPRLLKEILRQAAQARLRCKAEEIQARARQAGWERALWEGMFGALGYKRNVWPMRRIAGIQGKLFARDSEPANPLLAQSLLLGVSGLLPADLRDVPNESYLRQVWDVWWREADRFRESILPRELWSLAGIRPPNHPQRRLALAAHWICNNKIISKLEDWSNRVIESPDLVNSLEHILQVNHDPFWSRHWTLRSKPFSQARPLLGPQRTTDLAVNVILPWLYVRALAGKNHKLAESAEQRYFHWPSSEDNSVLKLARARLLGGVPASCFETAAEQQALLQIVKDFCDHSNAACDHCEFPSLVSALLMARE
jgi:hypothetical protein